MDLWNVLYFVIFCLACYGVYAIFNRDRFKLFILGCQFMINRFRKPSLIIKKCTNHLEFAYMDNGKPKTLLIPTNLARSFDASQCEVTINYIDGTTRDLVQDCIIPILVTASDLGATSITVYNTASGEERTYTGRNPVLYF